MRIFTLFLLLGPVWSRFERGTVIKKEELRGLPIEIHQAVLLDAVHDVVEQVIFSAKIKKTQYSRYICDFAQFMSGDTLKDYSDVEILSTLRSTLTDSELKITRSYCGSCPRNGYKLDPNCRVLLVEW